MVRRLQAGAGPDLPSHSGNTPLHVACAAGARLPLLRLLTHARADVHARNCRDETPLHLLAMSAAFEAGVAVAHLLECGGRVGARDERGDTPLHRAAAKGRTAVIPMLTRAGADINATTSVRVAFAAASVAAWAVSAAAAADACACGVPARAW